MMVARIAALCLLSSCASALRINKEDPELMKAEYVPYKQLPQYHPDGHALFGSCPANPKIAILVGGRASGMVTPASTASFKQHVLDYLHTKGATGIAGPKPDVFVHVKTGAGAAVASRAAAGASHSIVTHEMCEAAVLEMEATKHVIEDGWGDVKLVRHDCFVTKKQGKDPHHPEAEAGYWKSVQGVFQLMAQHEQESGAKYDIVVFHRPDHSWKHDVDYAKINNVEEMSGIDENKGSPANFYAANAASVSCEHGHIWGDQMMVLPRAASTPFMTLYDDLALSAQPKICGIDRNEDIFWQTQKSLVARGFNVEWSMARNAP